MNDREKIDVSYQMGQAVIVSKDIYNFSELLEQPLLKSLLNSEYEWVYRLIEIFNKGDVKEYATFKASVGGNVKIVLFRKFSRPMNRRLTRRWRWLPYSN